MSANRILDHLAIGIILTEKDGSIIYKNHESDRIFSASNIISRKSGTLIVNGKKIMSVYNHFIETRPSEQVTILDCHPHDSGFYIISIQKYNHNNQELYATFIYDPKYHDSINIRKIQIISNIRKIYSLSNSEAEVSYCIYAGMSIDEIAKHRKSSVNTIRTHIKNILSKTGLARQQDIVRLMADISMMPKIQ